MTVTERFLKYVKVHTASADISDKTPTTECQHVLCDMLKNEMSELGLDNVYSDKNAYVYGELPATAGCEDRPAVAFIAHIDTIPDFSGENVRPIITENYDGNDIVLGTSGRTIEVSAFPHLSKLKGQTLITTDGTTVLGADDKAGIAEILAAFENLLSSGKPHGRVIACFTPDEEVGHGAALLDLDRVNASFGYTVDGGAPNCLNYETFNAAEVKFSVNGFNIHPGDSKNKMKNASLIAMEINSMLPAGDTPAHTEKYEGFYHLCEMKGNIEKAYLSYIVRDHDRNLFEGRLSTVKHIEALINEKYGAGTAQVTIKEQYRNMAELIAQKPEILEIAKTAISEVGLKPFTAPVRGGTDGSQLTFRGLLCPNLGTGGYACHGPYEHITSERMEQCVKIIENIILLCK